MVRLAPMLSLSARLTNTGRLIAGFPNPRARNRLIGGPQYTGAFLLDGAHQICSRLRFASGQRSR